MLSPRTQSSLVLLGAAVILTLPGLARAADCNNNGVDDAQDIASGTSPDCNGNLRPDECDLVPGPSTYDISPNLAIPNFDHTGVSSTMIVPGSGAVTGLRVALHINHTTQQDLFVTLSHAGVTRALVNRPGSFGCSPTGYFADNFGSAGTLLVLDDAAPVGIDCYAGPTGGIDNYAGPARPTQGLASFNGLDRGGPWTLTVSDRGLGADVGALVTWRLEFVDTSALSEDCNANDVPDECDEDCNANGTPDECDVVPAVDGYGLTPNLSIPDNNPTGVSSTINVPDSGAVANLDLALHINHAFQGDLVITLSHAGVTRTLIQRSGLCSNPAYGYDADNFGSASAPLILDDDAGAGIDCYAGSSSPGIAGYAGPARPNQALAAFNGLDRAGPWTLTVADVVGLDVGALVSWRLDFVAASAFSEDCNTNGLPDECDFTPRVRTYRISPNLPIPDFDWQGGVSSTINVPGSGEVGDLEVLLHIQHPLQGDLRVELSHGGIRRRLIYGGTGTCFDPLYGYPADNFGSASALLVLDDDADTEMDCYAGPSSPGIDNYAGPAYPWQSLSAFHGLNSAGDWTLHVYDTWGSGYAGTFVTWELRVHTPASGDCNTNAVPDECEVAAGSPDCNANDRPDECDLVRTITTEYAAMPNVSIPSGFSSVSSTITVPDSGPIDDLNVGLFITHSWQGDLVATLSHAGVTITLLNQPGECWVDGGYDANNLGSPGNPLVLDDSAAPSIDCYAGPSSHGINGYAGPARPNQPLSAFDGLDRAGNWTLTVSDVYQEDFGTLVSWRLDLGTLGDNDCNINSTPDDCEADCNANGTPDECDLESVIADAYALSPNLSIPDSNLSGVSSTMTVPEAGTIADLDLGLHIDHTFQGDLMVTLSHAGVTATLINRSGLCFNPNFGYEADHFGSASGLLILDDSAATGIDCYAGPSSPGTNNYAGPAASSQPLAVFEGLEAAGEWTLTVSDHATIDVGTLVNWELHLTTYAFDDCHDDGVLDECQIGDCDSDDDLDFSDISPLAGCMNGPAAGPAGSSCSCLLMDCDADVDLADYAALQEAVSP